MPVESRRAGCVVQAQEPIFPSGDETLVIERQAPEALKLRPKMSACAAFLHEPSGCCKNGPKHKQSRNGSTFQEFYYGLVRGMIVVRLNGGLGNQLFQYAAGRALAKQRGTVVKLDRTWVDADRKRSYALGAWNIPAAFVTAAYLGWLRLQNAVGHRVFPHAPYYRRAIVREQAMTFDVNVLRAPRTCVLEGYWQSEEYFLAVEPLIRREFTLREEPSSASRKIAQTILGENSIFVHIRRGDYVSESGTVAVHGTCSPDYYRRAAEYIAARVLDPHFFVFSDEPQWVSQHFHLPYRMSVVDHNSPGDSTAPGREHEDLWLMSLCKHAILANSSFSWWGAWLNPERERLVIAPKRWFQSLPHDTRDLIPQNWLRM